MSIFMKGSDVPLTRPLVHGTGGDLVTKVVHGQKVSFRIATSQPGFHSAPHKHPNEQITYCLEGAMWIYVDNKAYELKAGDFLRVPPNAAHWGWVRGDKAATLIEVQAPAGVLPGKQVPPGTGLFDPDEKIRPEVAPEAVDVPGEFAREVEEKYGHC